MDWEKARVIGEVVSAGAVVASLIFVGVQVHQGSEETKLNTQAIKAAASFEATHSWATFNELALTFPEDKLMMAIATHDPNKTWEDFGAETHAFMMVFYRALFQKLEGQYYMYQYGSLDKDLWEGRRDWAASVIKLPFYKVLWEREKNEKIWSDRFIRVIEQARDSANLQPNNYYADKLDPAGG